MHIKKIIVPVDFSKPSETAVHYAAGFAQAISAKVELVHVIDTADSGLKLHNWQKLEKQMIESADTAGARLLETVANPIDITFQTIKGFPFRDRVNEYITERHGDLLVMGTHGASGVKKILMGSNAATMVESSVVPVIVVPHAFAFQSIKKIVYATDMAHLDEEIKTIAKFAGIFGAEIVVLHVVRPHAHKRDRSSLHAILTRMSHYKNIRIEEVRSEDVVKGIESGVGVEEPELVAMFTHELELFEKITGKGNTRQMAFGGKTPLLAFKRTSKRR